MQKLLILFLSFFIGLSATSQFRFSDKEQSKIDSLYKVINKTNYDTTLASAYAQLAYIFFDNDLDSNAKYNEKAITIAEKGISETTNPQIIKSFKTSLAWGYLSKVALVVNSDIKLAAEFHDKVLKLVEELDIKILIAHALATSSNLFLLEGNFLKARDTLNRAIIIYKELNAKKYIGQGYTWLGLMYFVEGDIMNALDHLKIGLKFLEAINDQAYISINLTYFGMIYYSQGDHLTALEFYDKALKISIKLNDKTLISSTYCTMAKLYIDQSNYALANKILMKGLKLCEEIESTHLTHKTCILLAKSYLGMGDFSKALKYINYIEYNENYIFIVTSLYIKGTILFEQGKLAEAKKNGLRCLEISQSIGIPASISQSSELLNKIYKKEKNWQKANAMHELYIQMRDSINNQENQKAAIQLKFQQEYEKKKLVDSIYHADEIAIQQAEGDLAEAELKSEKTFRWALYFGIGFILVFLAFVINRFRISQKQKGIIEKQHHKLDESHSELKDSITYAKRLQEAILPPKKLVKQWLPQSFILYKPKAIVAGDFYWMETLNGWIYFAAADCTGHGVPGAMVSVVCSNALSKALIEESRTKPAEILNRARELVIERFGRSEKEIKDGMDISLCAFNQQTGQLQWAGANNPLWIIRARSELIEEVKADRQPIGRFSFKTPFKNHEIQLNKGDNLYIFTDGFSDQFGGEKGKKYKVDNFKSFLLSIKNKDMDSQRSMLNEEFENWQGTFEQLDDVCIMGVKI